MNSATKFLFIFFVIVAVVLLIGAIGNQDVKNVGWQMQNRIREEGVNLLCPGVAFLVILFSLALADPAHISRNTNKPLDSTYEDITGKYAEFGEHAVFKADKGNRFFVIGRERGRLWVQEYNQKAKPISGKTYADPSAWKIGSSPNELLGNYIKGKVNTGRKIP